MATNTTIIEGVILNEPSLNATRSEINVSNFVLQVANTGDTGKTFTIGITAWGKNAELCASLYSKGSKVRVCGELMQSPNTKEIEIRAKNVFSIT
jgi:single-stranded DNA-binding protein